VSQALQRVVVRLMIDPAWCRQVFDGAPTPELSAAERALLLAADPRAFGVDTLRRGRLLTALVEEFPASVALLADGGRIMGRADAFLSSPDFHHAVQERLALAPVFGAWLVARVGGVARIELAAAQGRRDPPPVGPGLHRGPGVRVLHAPAGSLDRFAALRQRLGEAPLDALASGVSILGLPAPGRGQEALLVEPDRAGGGGVGLASEGLVALLQAASPAQPRSALRALALRHGALEEEVDEVLDDLLSDGLLVDLGG
jgi:hypothetical protein